MRNLTSLTWACAAVSWAFVIGNVVVRDIATFHEVLASGYKTPWFDERWWMQPYTHARLAFVPAKEHWTQNYIGSERWLVREYDVNGTVFWTTLERVPTTLAGPA